MTNSLAYGISLMSDRFNVNFLTPNSDCPFKEHGLLGKTYGNQMEKEGRRFKERYLDE